jgi:hypothetical protein
MQLTTIQSYSYGYDFSYSTSATQEQIYKDLGAFILKKALEGYNGTIFAYGQTGTGKTHCIMGSDSDPGLIPRVILDTL